MTTHTGEKQYQYNVCMYESGSVKIHMLTHTGNKQYQCNICHHTFTDNHHLKGHMDVDTGE